MARRDHDYEPGDVIRGDGGDYSVLAVLGSGGMGAVYLVKDRNIGKRFVLKILHRWLAHRHDLKEHFEHEARALGHLSHEGIIEIFYLGRTTDHRMPYYLMEVLSGESLGDAIWRHGKLALFTALGIATKMLYALQHAHERGIIHRDIKPDNVFLHQGKSSEPIVKLLDFGILKLAEAAEDPKVFIGTPRYAAPEQLAGRIVGPRADLYSSGVALFQMLTGRLPFETHGPSLEAMVQTLTLTAPSLNEYGDYPAELVDLVARALAKDPGERPADAFSFASDLQRIRRAFAPNHGDVHEHVTAEVIARAGRPLSEPSQITNAHLAAPTDPDTDMDKLMSALERDGRSPTMTWSGPAEAPVTGFESTALERKVARDETDRFSSPRAALSGPTPAPPRPDGVDREAKTVLPAEHSSVIVENGASGSVRYLTHEAVLRPSLKPPQVTVPMAPSQRPLRQHLTVPMRGRPTQHGDDTRPPESQTTEPYPASERTAEARRARRRLRLPRSVSLKGLLLAGLVGITTFAAGLSLMTSHAPRPTPVARGRTAATPTTASEADARVTDTRSTPSERIPASISGMAVTASVPPAVAATPAVTATLATATTQAITAAQATTRSSVSGTPPPKPVARASASPATPKTSASPPHGYVGFDP